MKSNAGNGIQNRTQVVASSSQIDSNDDTNITTLPIDLPADGHPRVIFASPCSGSSATIQFTERILRAHGYNISHGGQPILKKPKEILEKAKELFRAKMDREPTLQETLGEAFAFYNERAKKDGQIVLFKINNPSHEVLNSLNQLGTKFAYTYRSNVLDRAICASRDCFTKGRLGHPVHANGTEADACFNRRQHSSDDILLANFSDTRALIAQMEEWEIKDERTKNHYKSLYDPAKALAYEDLFRFEYTDSEYIFKQSVEAWCAFLQTFGDIKVPTVERVLLAYRNSRPPRSPYEETIYNFDDVKKTFEGSKFNDYLSR